MCYIYRWIGKNILVLGATQMPTWFLTWFSARFSQWEPVDIFTGENGSENQPQVLTWMRTDHENQFYFIFIFWGRTEQVLAYNLHSVLRVPVPVGAAVFYFYIFYALLLATSCSVFFFSVLWFSIKCEQTKEDIALISSKFFRTVQLWWRAPSKQKTSLQNDEILSNHL